ncbi:acetyltransferase (isoleucine patch superfamily) [Rivularia sp. PCC 7116]|uniref:acyltransferase n=1 Tax=Rivularia sp. PCC 7116 TaxID=373994 RepID=UPI00029EEB7B|nr:acyltransferase [Rivularia sp. PCC 7116]AFY58148.1 acetyltransferase (isoleucine patch superfamily) [Rivularia sp. PCC 7116]
MSFKKISFFERFITTIFGGIPNIFFGKKIRNFVYRSLLHRIGKSVNIQHFVELIGTPYIEIGNGVSLLKGVQINALGHPNNKVSIKDRVRLERGVDIRSLHDTHILIDENAYIGPYVIVTGTGNVKIGKNCLIAPHCGIFANNHVFADPTQTIEAQGTTGEGIVIENDCWLGHNVTVLDGVVIGEGSIIGAGSVVNKSIPAFSIAVGTPARVIKNRLDKQTANLSSQLPSEMQN